MPPPPQPWDLPIRAIGHAQVFLQFIDGRRMPPRRGALIYCIFGGEEGTIAAAQAYVVEWRESSGVAGEGRQGIGYLCGRGRRLVGHHNVLVVVIRRGSVGMEVVIWGVPSASEDLGCLDVAWVAVFNEAEACFPMPRRTKHVRHVAA